MSKSQVLKFAAPPGRSKQTVHHTSCRRCEYSMSVDEGTYWMITAGTIRCPQCQEIVTPTNTNPVPKKRVKYAEERIESILRHGLSEGGRVVIEQLFDSSNFVYCATLYYPYHQNTGEYVTIQTKGNGTTADEAIRSACGALLERLQSEEGIH